MTRSSTIFCLFVAFSFIGAICAASSSTCTPATFTQTITPQSSTFKLLNIDGYAVKTVYETSTSGNIEVSISGCVTGTAPEFSLVNNANQVSFSVTASNATGITGSNSGQGQVTPSSASRVNPLSSLLVVASLFLFSKNRISAIFLVVVLGCMMHMSTAAGTGEITVTIRLPASITTICEDGNCARINGVVSKYVSVFGHRYATLDAAYGTCDAAVVMQVPAGWTIAGIDSNSLIAIAFANWAADGIVVADGLVYEANSYNTKTTTTGALTTSALGYKSDKCSNKILITQASTATDTASNLIQTPVISHYITFNGYDYAVADNTAYNASTAGREVGCVQIKSTDAWQLAPDSDEVQMVLKSPTNIFGTSCLIVQSGHGYKSDLSSCGSVGLLVTISQTDGSNVLGVGKGNNRLLVRRASTSPDSFATANITKQFYLYTNTFATIDNASPYSKTDGACQAHFQKLPAGWNFASLDNMRELASFWVWSSTTCFVSNVGAIDRSGANCDSNLLTRTIGGVDYYTTTNCGRILLVKPVVKQTDFQIGMKVLVISPVDNTTAGGVALATQMLTALGMSYDSIYLIKNSENNKVMYPNDLPLYDDEGVPKYYGIITTAELLYQSGGSWPKAISSYQESQLKTYKFVHSVRDVLLYTYPYATGVTTIQGYNAANGSALRVELDFVKANPSIFAGLKNDTAFDLHNEYYFSIPTASVGANMKPVARYVAVGTASPKSTDPVIAAVVTDTDGSQQMQFYVGNALYLVHGPVLASMWLTWVTKGVYSGSRRIYLSPQIDDLFLSTEQYSQPTNAMRMTGDDLRKTAAFLQALPAPAGSDVTLEFGFNCAEVVVKNGAIEDDLVTAVRQLVTSFWWESHTWSHLDLTCPDSNCTEYGPTTYEEAKEELDKNIDFTRDLLFAGTGFNGLDQTHFAKDCMITPKISGMFNPDSLKALKDDGILCVVGDNSVPALNPDDWYQGSYTTVAKNGQDGIFIIPRYATEIYYDTCLPETAVAQYNYRYGPGGIFGSVYPISTLDDILEREASSAVRILAQFRHDPYMFHQGNLYHFPYNKTGDTVERDWSLVTLWLQTVVEHYNKVFTFPLRTVGQAALRDVYFARRARDACGASATMTVAAGARAGVHMQTTGVCEMAVTGLNSCTGVDSARCRVEQYGPDTTVWAKFSQNDVMLPASGAWN